MGFRWCGLLFQVSGRGSSRFDCGKAHVMLAFIDARTCESLLARTNWCYVGISAQGLVWLFTFAPTHPPGAEVCIGRATVWDASATPCRGTRGVRAERGVGAASSKAWSQEFWSEVVGAGLLSGTLVSKRLTCVKFAVSKLHWRCMGQCEELHFGRRLGPDHAKVQRRTRNCGRRHRRRSLERHFWTCFEQLC